MKSPKVFKIFFISILILSGCVRSKTSASLDQTTSSLASFAQRQVRYMTPMDLIQTMKLTFGEYDNDVISGDCLTLTSANRSLLGDSLAATGSPVSSEPNSSFVRWYVGCLTNYTEAMNRTLTQQPQSLKTFLGPTLSTLLAKDSAILDRPFASLSSNVQLQITSEQIERMIGPSDVISDFGYYPGTLALALKISNDLKPAGLNTRLTLMKIMLAIAVRDEFMSY